ncbi:unnamed protein product [Absidia cylindrospora]
MVSFMLIIDILLNHSVDIPIKAIVDVDQYGGFLRSSPKLTLYLDTTILADTTNSASLMMVSDTDSLSVQVAKRIQLAAAVGVWTCPICSHDNTSLTEKCDLCGVRTVNPNSSNSHSNSNNNTTTSSSPLSTVTPGACPICTFINHPSMIQCEMCDSALQSSSPSNLQSHTTQSTKSPSPSCSSSAPPAPSSSSSSSLSSTNISKYDHSVQLSFRKGGLAQFLTKLNSAITNKAWDSPLSPGSSTSQSTNNIEQLSYQQQQQPRRAVGLQGIQQRIEKLSTENADSLTDAFQDLDRLMAKANDMVKLAETISGKMNKSANDQDLSTLRGYMINLGISNPVTRGTAGSIYHQELSRELAEFLDKLYTKKENDIRPLTDIYCIFNRARGVALVSPEDLYTACQQFELLKLPYRLRKLSASTSSSSSSGLLVVQSIHMNDDQASKRVLDLVKRRDGHLTALQLADAQQWAIAVALDQLKMAEQKGLLCRDEGPGGLVFYENLFIT